MINMILLISLLLFGITSLHKSPLLLVEAQTPIPTGASSSLYTYYSFGYSSTYSCWTEGPPYTSSYVGYKYLYYVTSDYSVYSTGYYTYTTFRPIHRRDLYSFSQLTNSSCDYVDKWTMTQYECPYTHTSSGPLCTQRNITDGIEFWRKISSGASGTEYSYCKYTPMRYYQCQPWFGTWQGSYYSSGASSCSWNSWYYLERDNCFRKSVSSTTSAVQTNISCTPYSAQYTSLCYPQYTFPNLSPNTSSCISFHQLYSSCYSCGYDNSYFYDNSGSWTYSTSYNCKNYMPYRTFLTNYTDLGFSMTSEYYTSTVLTYRDGNYNPTWTYTMSYYKERRWTTSAVSGDYNCYVSTSVYSYYYYQSAPLVTNLGLYLMCDPYRQTINADSTHYTSFSTNSYSYRTSWFTYTSYSYATYGLISFQGQKPTSYFYDTYFPVTSWFTCQLLYNSTSQYTSCDPLTIRSYISSNQECSSYLSNYLSCSQVPDNSTSTTPYPYSIAPTGSYSSWLRTWLCTEGGTSYTTCKDCQYYYDMKIMTPFCYLNDNYYNYYNSSYVNASYTIYSYSLYQDCYSTFSWYTSQCSDSSNTPPRTSPVTPAPPSTCSPNYCLNNGTCVTTGCPSGYPRCCICPPSHVGERCDTNRTFVMQSTLRILDPFLPQLMDPSTELYKNYSSIFTYLWYNVTVSAMRQTYGETDTVNIRVVISRFKPGSVIAVIITHGALTSTNATLLSLPIQLTEESLRRALAEHCESMGICGALNLDKNHLTFNATPNVCEDSVMHLCSPYAKCSYHGGVDYTCECLPGHRDDGSLFGKGGTVCTEACYRGKCQNGGLCQENMNSQAECQCPPDYSGKYCEIYSMGGYVPSASMCVIVFLLVLIVFRLVKIVREPKREVRPCTKMDLMM